MKKVVSLLTAFVMCAVLLVSALPAFAEEAAAEEDTYARFTALGNDPYATFTFSSSGNNANIDPDTVVWAAIRYRTESQYDSTGVEYKAQFYINPAAEPCVPITYNFSKAWETAIVDLTATNESTTLDSKWDSTSYTSTGAVRFDPLEPDRDSEDTSSDDINGQVQNGDYIDIKWIAFFEKKEDAEAYTGAENTPYCILDFDSFRNPSGAHNLKVKIFEGEGTNPGEEPDDGFFYLYDKDMSVSTGWWLHPLQEDISVDVTFEINTWFNGFNYFAYCCPTPVPIRIALMNEDEDEVWTTDAECHDNIAYTVDMGASFAPGIYTISFIGGDVSDIDTDTWFVLGSAPINEALDEESVTIMGGATNSDTASAPFISFKKCEADPNVTEAPTKVPATQAPTAEPTEVPATAEPTVKATDAPATENADTKTAENDNKGNEDQPKKDANIGLIIGIIAAALVVICAVVVIILSLKKKKK